MEAEGRKENAGADWFIFRKHMPRKVGNLEMKGKHGETIISQAYWKHVFPCFWGCYDIEDPLSMSHKYVVSSPTVYHEKPSRWMNPLSQKPSGNLA